MNVLRQNNFKVTTITLSNPTKDNDTLSLSVIKIVKYCGVREGALGGGGDKIVHKEWRPLPSVIKIVK